MGDTARTCLQRPAARQRHDREGSRRLRRDLFRTEVAERALGTHPRHPTARSTRRRRQRRPRSHRTVRVDHSRPGRRWTPPPPRLSRSHHRHLPPDDVAGGRPSAPHPLRHLGEGPDRGRRWLALDGRYLKKHPRAMGGLYQSVLRNELAHRFGIAWGDTEKGQAEMSAIPDELLTIFSKRTDQIDEALAAKIDDFVARQGRDLNQWELGAIKREAAVDTRAHKSGNGVPDLTTRWDREAAAVGWTGLDLVDALEAQRVDTSERPPAISVDSLIDALSTAGSSWNRAQIVGALTDLARPDPTMSGGEWASRIEAWADAIAARCVELDPEQTNAQQRASDGRSMWHEPISPHITTEAILAEEELIASGARRASRRSPAVAHGRSRAPRRTPGGGRCSGRRRRSPRPRRRSGWCRQDDDVASRHRRPQRRLPPSVRRRAVGQGSPCPRT
ncbi:MAG: relaxase domain-containing protein [Ilumatobacteraceae bacterium]